jgi:hypothetical protein
VSKFLIQVDLRLIKNLIVTAETEEGAIDAASIISAEALALGESDDESVQVLGDEPVGHGSGGVYLLAAEGTPEWEQEFGKEITQ